jgi:hypothetical protein
MEIRFIGTGGGAGLIIGGRNLEKKGEKVLNKRGT